MMKTLFVVSAVLVAAFGNFVPAYAGTGDLPADASVLDAVQAVPGGVIVDAHTAVWPELSMTLTVPSVAALSAIGTCPHGSVCVFSGSSLTGARLSWTSCGTYSTAALRSPVRSIADARSTGRAEAKTGATVLATAFAQSWNNVAGNADSVACH